MVPTYTAHQASLRQFPQAQAYRPPQIIYRRDPRRAHVLDAATVPHKFSQYGLTLAALDKQTVNEILGLRAMREALQAKIQPSKRRTAQHSR